MLKQTLAIALCALLLTGCASMADRLRGSLEPPAERGYAILSLTGKSANPDSAMLGLNIANASGRIVAADSASLLTDTVFGEQGKSMAEGKLLLFTLEPGQYRVEQVWANWLEDGAWGVSRKMRSFRLAAPFEVKRGEAVYLGNVNVEMSFCRKHNCAMKPSAISRISAASGRSRMSPASSCGRWGKHGPERLLEISEPAQNPAWPPTKRKAHTGYEPSKPLRLSTRRRPRTGAEPAHFCHSLAR